MLASKALQREGVPGPDELAVSCQGQNALCAVAWPDQLVVCRIARQADTLNVLATYCMVRQTHDSHALLMGTPHSIWVCTLLPVMVSLNVRPALMRSSGAALTHLMHGLPCSMHG